VKVIDGARSVLSSGSRRLDAEGFGHVEVTESPARIDGEGDELVLAGAREKLAAADSASSAPAGSERRERSAEEMAGVDEWQVGGGGALPPHIPPTGAASMTAELTKALETSAQRILPFADGHSRLRHRQPSSRSSLTFDSVVAASARAAAPTPAAHRQSLGRCSARA